MLLQPHNAFFMALFDDRDFDPVETCVDVGDRCIELVFEHVELVLQDIEPVCERIDSSFEGCEAVIDTIHPFINARKSH